MKRPFSVIAIDGGGTRCRLAGLAAERRWSIEVGGSNVSTNLPMAVSEIRRGLEQLAGLVGASLESLQTVPAYAGLAGVIGSDMAAAVAAGLPLQQVRVEDDRRAAVRGALENRDGGVAHCGTGSFVAIQNNRQIRLCGGWGAVLGDQASAMWVGREALGATLDVVDGIRAPSPLTTALLRQFGSAADIVGFAGEASPAEFGALAPAVTGTIADGDPVAMEILQRGAQYLHLTLQALSWKPPMPLVLGGGLAACYADFIAPPLLASLTPASGQPIDGALSLAQDFASEFST